MFFEDGEICQRALTETGVCGSDTALSVSCEETNEAQTAGPGWKRICERDREDLPLGNLLL